MFEMWWDGSGMCARGEGGHACSHWLSNNTCRPSIGVSFLSDMPGSLGQWYPLEKPANVKLDTGADVTCISSRRMAELGLKQDPSDAKVFVRGVGGSTITARRKWVTVRIAPFTERIACPIHYSRDFRDDLFIISLATVVQYYAVVMTDRHSVFFPK